MEFKFVIIIIFIEKLENTLQNFSIGLDLNLLKKFKTILKRAL
jgi:hypothetical protein